MTHEIDLYINKVNKVFECDVMQENRKGDNVLGRIALGNFMRNSLKMTFQSVADELLKNHATIIHYCKQHQNYFQYDKNYREKYNEFTKDERPTLKICNEISFYIQKIA